MNPGVEVTGTDKSTPGAPGSLIVPACWPGSLISSASARREPPRTPPPDTKPEGGQHRLPRARRAGSSRKHCHAGPIAEGLRGGERA